MARSELPPGLQPSLKDRLFDPDSMGTAAIPGYTLQRIIDSVRDDLEDLFNTRRGVEVPVARYSELAKSVATYGLPDLTSLNTTTMASREGLGLIMEQIITQHEPRLRKVKVTMATSKNTAASTSYHIDAELCVDPSPPVAFETDVQLSTGHVVVRDGTG